MTAPSPHPRPMGRPAGRAAGALALLAVLSGPAPAQDRQTFGPAPILTVGAAESASTRRSS